MGEGRRQFQNETALWLGQLAAPVYPYIANVEPGLSQLANGQDLKIFWCHLRQLAHRLSNSHATGVAASWKRTYIIGHARGALFLALPTRSSSSGHHIPSLTPLLRRRGGFLYAGQSTRFPASHLRRGRRHGDRRAR